MNGTWSWWNDRFPIAQGQARSVATLNGHPTGTRPPGSVQPRQPKQGAKQVRPARSAAGIGITAIHRDFRLPILPLLSLPRLPALAHYSFFSLEKNRFRRSLHASLTHHQKKHNTQIPESDNTAPTLRSEPLSSLIPNPLFPRTNPTSTNTANSPARDFLQILHSPGGIALA